MKSIFLAAAFSLFALSAGAQVIYNSSGRPRSESRDHDEKRESYFGKKEGFDASRIIWGGGVALSFSQGYFSGGLSPIVGYNITDNFSAGLGLGYRHYRQEDAFQVPNIITNQYSYYPFTANLFTPSVWTRYLVWRNIFIHAEAEYNSFSYKEWDMDRDPTSASYGTPVSERVSVSAPALLIGPGLRQPLSDKVSLVTMLLVETLRDVNSPYSNSGPGGLPIDLRFGINVNFGAPDY